MTAGAYRAERSRPWWRYLPLPASLVAILVATLSPVGSGGGEGWTLCLVCGSRGVADALLNVILFVPLGASAALITRSDRGVVLLGAFVSLGVELVQLWTPGRDPTFGDTFFNTLGTAAGLHLVRSAASWTRTGARAKALIGLTYASAALLLVALTGWLLRPAFPNGVYFGQWTADLGDLERYSGRVVSAEIAGITLPSRRLADSDAVRRALEEGQPLRIVAVAGSPPSSLAPLFSIYDHRQREVLFIGIDRSDVLVRLSMRAERWRLDRPDVRVRDAMADRKPGDRIQIELRGVGPDQCFIFQGTSTCDLAHGVSDGWKMLLFWESLSTWLQRAIGGAWLVALCAPVALFAGGRWQTLLSLALLAVAIVIVPPFVGLRPTNLAEIVTALAGLGAGALARDTLRINRIPPT